jgi:hypothetical protein
MRDDFIIYRPAFIVSLCDGWFTEGFDTANLREARALLEEIS